MITSRMMAIGVAVALLAGHAPTLTAQTVAPDTGTATSSTYSNDAARAALLILHLAKFDYFENFNMRPDYGKQVLVRYVDALDPEHIFYSSEDVAKILMSAPDVVSMIQRSDITMAADIAHEHADRVRMRIDYATALLSKGFEFGGKDTLAVRAASVPDFLPEQALAQRWEKIVKSDWLNLKLAGLADSQIKDSLASRYSHFAKALTEVDQASALVRYVNACIVAGDPNGGYWNGTYFEKSTEVPSFVGQLGLGNDADGPLVYKYGSDAPGDFPHNGDRLIGISTETGPITYLDGTNGAVAAVLLRSFPKDADVNLYVRRADTLPGAPVIKIPYASALGFSDKRIKLLLITPAGAKPQEQIAFISIPVMYGAVPKASDVSDSRADVDLQQELKQAREQGAVAAVLDLRGDRGGRPDIVARMAGLFLGSRSPWRTQQKDKIVPMQPASDVSIAWDGPLVVLVDGQTAGGAEMFTAALQDYGRALIVGNRTAAKGNIETLVDLNRFLTAMHPGETDLGALRMSTMGVFRANGESISGHGITPDITLPLLGARSDDERQPAPSIEPVSIDRFTTFDASYAKVTNKYRHLEDHSPELMQWLATQHRLAPDMQAGDELSLNLAKRQLEHDGAKTASAGTDPAVGIAAEIAYDQSRALPARAQQ